MKPRQRIVVLGVAACLVFSVGLGGVAYFFRSAPSSRPTTTASPGTNQFYSGTASHPMDTGSRGLDACLRALNEAGRDLQHYRQGKDRYPADLKDVLGSQPVCPVTRKPYGWIGLGDRALLHCSDSPHLNAGHRLRPVFDCSRDTATADWVPDNKPFDLFAQTFIASDEQDLDQAQTAAKAYMQTPGASITGWLKAIELEIHQGGSGAPTLINQARPLFPDNPLLTEIEVKSLIANGHFDEARTLVSHSKGNLDYCKALLACAQGDLAGAARLSTGALKGMVLFAQRDFQGTQKFCQEGLEKTGYATYDAPYYVEYLVLSGQALGGDGETLGRQILAKGLEQCPQVWPFPLLQFLNGELDEEALLKLAGPSKERQIEAHGCLGYRVALTNKKDEARVHFDKIKGNVYWESLTSAAWLKSL